MLRRASFFLGSLALATLAGCASSARDPSAGSPSETEGPSAPATAKIDSAHAPTTLGRELPEETGAHLAFSLRLADQTGLDKLLHDQQDPKSPSYRAWLTPAQFGERFGLPEATYARIVSWLEGEGFVVTRYPNRLFVEATGSVHGVRSLLGVRPRMATRGARTFRTYVEPLSLPPDIAPLVVKIGGLDTRTHLRHRINATFQGQTYAVLGAADIRLEYDMPETTTTAAAGLTTVVLATQEGTQTSENGNPGPPLVPPSTTAIQAYFTTIANATATYNPVVMTNTNDDFDTIGANVEYQLDVEMQSVGAPNAKDIDLVLAPASEVFMTGAQYIVNMLPSAIVVSSSLGDCESEEVSGDGGATTAGSEAYVLRQAVQQGVAEGQTWFAAAGDSGADDCNDMSSGTHNGYDGGNATVDFPCSIPEFVCMGGTQFQGSGSWNDAGALLAVEPEQTWNEDEGDSGGGGAGGGGQSFLYAKPAWQEGIGPMASDGRRDVPDISLTAASGTPGVAVYDCGSGQDQWSCQGENTGTGTLDIIGGTSVASPLGAGIFARLAGATGCRLGDIHPNLYALGTAQQGGGASPFNDITIGNNNYVDPNNQTIIGFAAGPGYDLATGWGTVNFAKLAAAWPACDGGLTNGDAGAEDSGPGSDAGAVATGDSGSPGEPVADGGSANNGAAGASSGCGCTTAGTRGPGRSALLALVALGTAALRRRRRANRS